jgi:hypothetical protein
VRAVLHCTDVPTATAARPGTVDNFALIGSVTSRNACFFAVSGESCRYVVLTMY